MTQIEAQVKHAAELLNSGDVAAAEQLGREVLAVAPQNINVLRLMGAVSRKQGRLEESLDYFRRAVALNDHKGLLHFELGTAYTELQRNEEAYESYLKAVQLDPSLQPAYVNLSAIMEQHERYEEAIEWAKKAIALKPECGLSYYNLANAQRELGQLDAATQNYAKALKFKPDRAKTLWNLGICHLLASNFREGWPLFEQRQDAQEVFFDHYTQPRWDGSSLAGKTIVVHAEQGIGDEILFASCFPDLVPLAKRCIFVCDPRLEKLLSRSFPQAGVYGHLRRKDWSPPAIPEPFDVQIPAGSLPLYFRSSPESFPRRERFLDVDPSLLAMWRERMAALGPGLKIGISWRAGGKAAESRKRTIPLDQWAGTFAVAGTQFVNLQYGDASADIAAAESLFDVEIHDWEQGDPLVDIDSFAAKIAALDLVISVGNATVHIAGAVGTTAWTLLPMVPSWRWMIACEESPWYGRVRLFRQQTGGEWQPVLARIESMLRERVGLSRAAVPTHVSIKGRDSILSSSSRPRDRRWFSAAELAGHKTDQLVAQALEEAKAAEQLGDLVLAERKYRETLQLAPRHFEALNGLGVVARKTGRIDLAIRSFQRSLSMIDALPVQQFNLADALADAGRFDEALAHYCRGIKLDPTNAMGHVQAGRMLNRLGRPTDALACFEQALLLAPGNEAAVIEHAQTLKALCRIDDAIEQLETAMQTRINSAPLAAALGVLYLEEQRFAEAAEQFRRATAIDPTLAAAFIDLARSLESLGRLQEATASLERAIALDASYLTAIMRLATLRTRLGELESAAGLLRRALELRPGDAHVLNALGVVLGQLGATDDALDCMDDAVHFVPDDIEAHVNRAHALLRVGRLADGWKEFEWREANGKQYRGPNGSAGMHNRPYEAYAAATQSVPYPVWDGSSLAGKTILILGEQDLADEIMFASCYRGVIERAEQCVIACNPPFERLIRRSFPRARVIVSPHARQPQIKLPDGLRIEMQIQSISTISPPGSWPWISLCAKPG
jgi:tetratricopeptide (TPR) repeat protein